jgi:hypothetical protein
LIVSIYFSKSPWLIKNQGEGGRGRERESKDKIKQDGCFEGDRRREHNLMRR